MIGLQARDNIKPVVNQCSTKERRPLGDIDVNRSHHKIILSKHESITGKGHIASGFKVFGDGEALSKKKAGIKISTKLATTLNDAKKKMISGKRPFQLLDEVRSGEQLVTKDTCVAMKKPEAAFFNSDVPTNGCQVAETERLKAQFALMSIEKLHNETQHQVPGTDANAAERDTKHATNGIARSTDIDLMQEYELPTFQLNAMAKEWNATSANATSGTLTDNETFCDATQLGIQKLPTFWNLTLEDTQLNLSKQHANTSGTQRHHNLPSMAQPCGGRKIVGRQLTALERPVHRNTVRELDDRTEEIERYNRDKKLRLKKAIEAMRVEQERLNWSAQTAQQRQLRPSVPTIMKNQSQPTVITATTNHAPTRTVTGIHGSQRANSSSFSYSSKQAPSLALAEKKSAPGRSSICIMKHPTPPNVLIRYAPAELLNLNYEAKYANKLADERYGVQQDVFSNMTHFSID